LAYSGEENKVAHKSVAVLLADAREIYGVFGKAEQALPLVEEALAKAPDNVEALNLRAAILYELDRDDEAWAAHQRALELEPCSVEALHGLAAIANDREEFADALRWLERGFSCISTDPYPEFRENEDYRQRLIAELYNEKAAALWGLGRQDEARTLLTEEAPQACPVEVENFEDQLDWLEHDFGKE
jgi:Flp pilus assembly protein TadD